MTTSRTRRAEALPKRLPDVPPAIVARMQDHLREHDFPARGLAAVMQDFYARLHAAGLPPELVTPAIYDAVGTSRSRLRALLAGLRAFAPEVPLAPAAEATRRWDAWLNARYNAKPPKPRASRLAGLPVADWPEAWRAALPALERTVRPYGNPLRPLAAEDPGRGRQCRGTARRRAVPGQRGRGSTAPDAPSPDLFEVVRALSAPRAGGELPDGIGLLRASADVLPPRGPPRPGEPRRARGNPGALTEAAERRGAGQARDAPRVPPPVPARRRASPRHGRRGRGRASSRPHHPGAPPAADRGRLRAAGQHGRPAGRPAPCCGSATRLVREADGTWRHDLRQGKTGGRKEMEALWPGTCALLDAHVLADRPAWQIETAGSATSRVRTC